MPALVDDTDAADAQLRQHLIASVQGPTDERIRYGRRWEQLYAHNASLYIPEPPRNPSAILVTPTEARLKCWPILTIG